MPVVLCGNCGNENVAGTRGIPLACCGQRRDAWQSASAPVCLIVWGRFSDFSELQFWGNTTTQRKPRTRVVCLPQRSISLNPLSQLCTPCSHIPSFAHKVRQSSSRIQKLPSALHQTLVDTSQREQIKCFLRKCGNVTLE